MAEEPTSTEQEGSEACAPEEPKDTLEEQLKELRNNLEAAQRQLKTAGIDIAQYEWQIDAISKLATDLEQTVDDYRPEYAGLLAAEKACRDFFENEGKCLREILGDDVAGEVPAIVQRIRDAVDELEDEIDRDEAALADKKTKREQALAKRDRLKAEFESLKKPAASIKERLNELETLKGAIKKAHDDAEYKIAYWLLTEAEKRLEVLLDGEPKLLIPPDELRKALKTAWYAYRDATGAFEACDGEVQEAEKALETKKAELTDMKKNLDASIRSELTGPHPSRSEAA